MGVIITPVMKKVRQFVSLCVSSFFLFFNILEDKSGLSDGALGKAVYDLVEDERNELAMEARSVALQLMEGDTPDKIKAEWAE